MSAVSRSFRSTPYRDAAATWHAIVALLSQGKNPTAAAELEAIAGIAASLIADAAPREAPIVVTCDGPGTRVYCTYDDEALDDSGSSENALGFDPLKGEWHVSLPCLADDLEWVQRALARTTTRITARDSATGFVVAEDVMAVSGESALTLDTEALFK